MNPKIPLFAAAVVVAGNLVGNEDVSAPAASSSAAELLRRLDPARKPTMEELLPIVEQAVRTGRWAMNKRWEIIINQLEPADMPPLLAVLAKYPPSGPRAQLTRAFYSRWAEGDPTAALAHAQTQPEREQMYAVSAVFQGWAYADPRPLAEWALAQPAGERRQLALGAAMQQIALEDPAAFAELKARADLPPGASPFPESFAPPSILANPAMAGARAEALTDQGQRNGVYVLIAQIWTARDPQAAANWAKNLKRYDDRHFALSVVLQKWLEAAPADAARFVADLEPGQLADSLGSHFFTLWAGRAPAVALDWLVRNASPHLQQQTLWSIGQQAARKDIPAALAAGESLPPGEGQRTYLQAVAQVWSEQDPAGALPWLLKNATPELMQNTVWPLGLKLAERDPVAALAVADRFSNRDTRERYLQAVLQAWSQQDAPAAFAWLTKNASAQLQQNAIWSIAQTWIQRDLGGALAAAEALPRGEVKQSFIRAIVQAWAQQDPAAALEHARALPAGELRHELTRHIINQWANQNPARALGALELMPTGREREEMFQRIIGQLAQTDPEAAIALVRQLPAGNARSRALQSIVMSIASRDLPRALELAAELPPGSDRMQAYQNLAGQYATKDPAGAVEWVKGLTPPLRQPIIAAMAGQLARQQPDEALALADLLPAGNSRLDAFAQVAMNWAQYDLPGVIAWMDRLPEGSLRQRAMGQVGYQWVRSDAAAAFAYALKLPEGPTRKTLFMQLGQQLGSGDASDAIAKAEQIREDASRQAYLQAIISSLAGNDAERAAEYAVNLPLGDYQGQAIQAVAGAWAYRDPAAAIRWLSSLADKRVPPQAYLPVAGQWFNVDPTAAMAWATSLPADERRDRILEHLLLSLGFQQPEDGLRMLELIKDPERRSRMTQQVVTQWLRTDRTAAETWLRQSSLPADVKEKLLKGADEQMQPMFGGWRIM